MYRVCIAITAIMLLVALAMPVHAQATSFTGTLTAADGGLMGSGSWLDKDLLQPSLRAGWFAPTITWAVTRNDNGLWDYAYSLSVYRNAISHFILEVSPTFQRGNMWAEDGNFGAIELGSYESGTANPNMPSGLYGVKFEETTGTTVNISFTSNRMPVWGDFYAKDGVTAGAANAVWNSGFTAPDYDPQSPAHSGSYMGHLLVPDTVEGPGPVPEPSSMAAFAMGLTTLVGLLRRRSA